MKSYNLLLSYKIMFLFFFFILQIVTKANLNNGTYDDIILIFKFDSLLTNVLPVQISANYRVLDIKKDNIILRGNFIHNVDSSNLKNNYDQLLSLHDGVYELKIYCGIYSDITKKTIRVTKNLTFNPSELKNKIISCVLKMVDDEKAVVILTKD